MEETLIEEFDYICKLNYNIFSVPICFVNNKGECIINYSETNQTYLSPSFKKHFEESILFADDKTHFPTIWDSGFYGNFAIIHIIKNEYIGSILIGPILYETLSKESIIGLVNDLDVNITKEKFIQYYDSIAILSKLDLVHIIQSIFYMIYGEKLKHEEIIHAGKTLNNTVFNEDETEPRIAERRRNLISYADPMMERKMIDCIMNGKRKELEEIFQIGNETGKMGLLDKKSHLRSQKNLAIVGIAIGTRATIDGGLHPEIAYTLSDLFIQHVEELDDSKLVMKFLKRSLLEFTDRVKRNNQQGYSKPISLCTNYIFSHLYEDLSQKKLAEVSDISQSYLSSLFSAEVGISINEYIQRAKIEEAVNLMTHTDYSLLEISNFLNFNDQSYFTKVFKKFIGTTPIKYRRGKGQGIKT